MEKLRQWIELWLVGKEVRGIKNVTLVTRLEIAEIYTAMIRKQKPEFINGKCKEILDKAGIETIECGVGYRVK